ncbi:hypothetical protein QVG61_05510 [Thiohalobacter sp. IOR34]|uniref:hypothetical protein n=1 Tax=Thiohalobacter sp. IOR34 TaxID=3057176 RepID=UPI0025AFB9EC|nr:hypothetical protein [Thiohalobacter sp. IOR34]WJW76546.1 hypothetical protein QVG61_05510 [Thiohalobacter sp. IOR34]
MNDARNRSTAIVRRQRFPLSFRVGALAVLLAAGLPAQAAKGVKLRTAAFCPDYTQGDTWTFRETIRPRSGGPVSQNTVTFTVTDIRGDRVTIEQLSSGSPTGKIVAEYRVDRNGGLVPVRTLMNNANVVIEQTSQTPICPPVTGAVLEATSQVNGMPASNIRLTFLGVAPKPTPVSVPAGTFDTYAAQYRITITPLAGGGPSQTTTGTWYMVKGLANARQTMETPEASITHELLNYSIQ